jgi:hypothetical protein
MQLEPLPYHVAVADRLEQAEPELWQWFRSDRFAETYLRETAVDLQRSGARLDRVQGHERHYRLAEAARDRLGLSEPIVLYHLRNAAVRPGAALVFTPGEIVVGFYGPILESFGADAEVACLIGREMARYKLFVDADGRYHTVDRLLAWLVQREGCPAELIETSRRHRLASEIYCDRGGLVACEDRGVTSRCLAAAIFGLDDAATAIHVAQAEQALAGKSSAPRVVTHPELHARLIALGWTDTLPATQLRSRLATVVSGAIELGSLDLLDQHRLVELTRGIVGRLVGDEAVRSETTIAHAREMFPDFEPPPGALPLAPSPQALSQSVVDYLAYLLLDLATLEGSGLKSTIAVAAAAADELTIGARFREIARQELRGRRGLQAGLASRVA